MSNLSPHPFWVVLGTERAHGDIERETWVVCVCLTEESANDVVTEIDAQFDLFAERVIEHARWYASVKNDANTDDEKKALLAEHRARRDAVVAEVVKLDRHHFDWHAHRIWMVGVRYVVEGKSAAQAKQRLKEGYLPFYDVSETSDDPAA